MDIREGDIFRWSYREPGDDRSWGRYHCCSRIAIVDGGGVLRDTYWSFGKDGRAFRSGDLPTLELTRLGNLSDLERQPEYMADYYDDADIVNLNHSNDSKGNFYLRKGSKRSAAKMLQSALRKFEQAQSEIRMATCRAEQLQAAIARIENGDTDIHI